MNARKVLSSILTITLIALAFVSILMVPAYAVPTVNTVALPAGSNPISLAFDGTYTYYASNSFGHIFRANPLAGTYTQIYTDGGGIHHWISMTFSSALYPNTPALYLVDSSSGTGNLYRFDLNSATLDCISDGTIGEDVPNTCASNGVVGVTSGSVWVAAQCTQRDIVGACLRYQSFIYSASGSRMFKIQHLRDAGSGSPNNPNNYYIFPYDCGTNPVLCSSGGVLPGITSDSSGNVYFTDRDNGKLYVYTADGNSLASYSGFTRPTGVAVVGSEVYVAENVANGNIVDFSLTTHSVVIRSPTTGTPFAVVPYGAGVAWSSSGTDHQICVLGGVCVITGEENYYMTSPSVGVIYFGFLGSAGVGVVSGLPSAPVSTTTSTTVVTTTTVVSGTTSTITSTSTVTSIVTTSIPASTTSEVTNECGGPAGSKCKWTPIVIPTIHVSQVVPFPICIVNQTCPAPTSVSISGFEFFLAGPSSGDFLQMVQLVGCCAMMMNNLNPSNGTFATISVTARPYNTNNYPDTPTPAPVMNSPLSPTSDTKFGWLCSVDSAKPNSEHITDTVWACWSSGGSTALPINYRTFSFSAPIHTIINIQATGTESQGQVSVENIFT